MKIEILGPGCYRCLTAEANVREALQAAGLDAEVKHVHDPIEIMRCGVKFTPALFIDGKIKASGRIPEVEQIRRWLEERRAA